MQKKARGKIVETKSFCSADHEKQWIRPYIDKFSDEHKQKQNLLTRRNRSLIEEWFSRELGYDGYAIYCRGLEEFLKASASSEVDRILKTVLDDGLRELVKLQSLDEAQEFIYSITKRCRVPLHMSILHGRDCCYVLVERTPETGDLEFP